MTNSKCRPAYFQYHRDIFSEVTSLSEFSEKLRIVKCCVNKIFKLKTAIVIDDPWSIFPT